MRYFGQDKEAWLELLSQDPTVWGLASRADTIHHIVNQQQVQAWQLKTGGRSCVVKYTPQERVLESPQQVTTELKAAGLLSGDFGPAAPLVARPLRIISDPDGGTFTISPYAGVCASKMRATAWKDFSPKQLEQKSQTLAVSLMLSQLLYSKLHDHAGRPVSYLHRDIKLSNTTYNQKHDFFVVIDYGTFCNVDRSDWFAARDLRYLDCQMGYYNPSAGTHAALSTEGLRMTTHDSLDMYLTGLAVAEMFAGRLPQQLDLKQYGGELEAYCQAVFDFSWANSPEVAAMPADMRSWLLKVLSPMPSDRPTAAEALQHPWLAAELNRVMAALAAAAPAWTDMVAHLKQDIKGNRSSSTSMALAASLCRSQSCSCSSSAASCGDDSSSSSSTSCPHTPAAGSSPQLSVCSSTPVSRSTSCSSLTLDPPSAEPVAAAAATAASTSASASESVHVMLLVINPQPETVVLEAFSSTTDQGVQVDLPPSSSQCSQCSVEQQQQEQASSQQGKVSPAVVGNSRSRRGVLKAFRKTVTKSIRGVLGQIRSVVCRSKSI